MCKFSDLPLLALKFSKFSMSFWKQEKRVSFPSNFTSLFIVMRHNSFVLSHLNLYMLWTKVAHQSANFQTFDCSHQNSKSFCHLSSHKSVNSASPFRVMTHNSSGIFWLKHYMLLTLHF